MRRGSSLVVVALLAVALVGCGDSSSGDSAETTEPTSVTESMQDGDQADGTAALEAIPTVESVVESDSSAGWTAASSLTGELTQIVSWSEGFAAIMRTADEPGGEGGALWYSGDGVEWEAASVGRLGATDDIYSLVGQDDQLFALSGDFSDDATPQTLWRRRSGERWEEVMTDDALQRIAVNADRLVAYTSCYRWIVGVFDTATAEPVEFTGLPSLGEANNCGEVTALDEGFLALAWSSGGLPDPPDPVLLYSADGTSWMQHPSPPEGGAMSPYGPTTAPTFDGRNLVPSFSTSWPQMGGAWVTDTGMAFEPIPEPVTDGVGDPYSAANLVLHTNSTDAGFIAVERGIIYQSLDGLDWTILESPPTWTELADSVGRGLARGTILATDDSLIAVGVHGEIEGWVGLVNPSTEIWVTGR